MNKWYFPVLTTLFLAGCTGGGQHSSVKPVEDILPASVTINDSFWSPRIENNYKVSVPDMLDVYARSGQAPNGKLIEAVGYILQVNDDPVLQAKADSAIEKMIPVVLPDGTPRKWQRLLDGEMYSAGHFMEAAVEYYRATGSRRMLDVAITLADDIDNQFGQGKRIDVSQHEEIKIGLLKLYGLTGDEKYMKLAKFFLDERGYPHEGHPLYGEYAQDHKPVVEQEEVVGHTVRATYLYTPLAELAVITGDPSYIRASDNLWSDATGKKTFITGSIGSYRDHEDYGEPYDLPNASCWNETCASIGSIFWNQQMFSLHRDARYIDMMEKILYNGFLSGVSLDGSKYFYQNPLKSFGNFERQPWFGPNCCPPNVVRMMASLGKYIYAKSDNDFYVNLFAGSEYSTSVDGTKLLLKQETAYPWNGEVKISVEPDDEVSFTLFIRIPGWTGNEAMPGGLYSFVDQSTGKVTMEVNGENVKVEPVKGYVPLKRKWKKGDVVELYLPMEARLIKADERVPDDAGMVAVQRGPLVYCAEETDNEDDIWKLVVPEGTSFSELTGDDLPGIVKLEGEVEKADRDNAGKIVVTGESRLVMVPYYAWANRTIGRMSVWLAGNLSKVVAEPAPSIASTSTVRSSCGTGSLEDNYPGGNVPTIAKRFYPRSQSGSAGFSALYDEVTPVNSMDGSSTYFAMRPAEGNHAWVEYDFSEPAEISSSDVYWKDDKQYCQVPESWRLLYRSGNEWVPVKNTSPYTVDKDKFNHVGFEPVTTGALRMEITLRGLPFKKGELGPPDGNYMPEDTEWYETGIIEWGVK